MKQTYLFTQSSKLFCVDPIPDPFHIVPVSYNAMFHGVFDFEEAAIFLGAPSDKSIAFESTCHNACVFWPTDAKDLVLPQVTREPEENIIQRGKETLRVVLTSKACFDGTGALETTCIGDLE